MNNPKHDFEHYKALFQMIVHSCEQERLAIMHVRCKSSDELQLAIVSVSLNKGSDKAVEAEVIPLAILLSPTSSRTLEPVMDVPEDWEIVMETEEFSLELDDRNRWRPPTRGTL